MMFSKVAALALPAFAAAASVVTRHDGPKCNTGPVQCCNTVTNVHDPTYSKLFGLLGLLGTVNAAVPIGISCLPIDVLAIDGQSCSAQTVCCHDNQYNGVVNIGCSPISL